MKLTGNIGLFISLAGLLLATLPSSGQEQATVPTGTAADSVLVDATMPNEDSLPWERRMQLGLDQLGREATDASFIAGISVWDLTADSLLWGYNNSKTMRPASTQKVLTAIAALDMLGAQHEFKTQAYYTGTITLDSTLQGDIYVVGDFDPLYSFSDLNELAREIRSLGISHISGGIHADAGMKSNDLYGYGWCWDDVPSKFEPYLCALMLERGQMSPNFNSYSKSPLFHPAADFAATLAKALDNLGVRPADSLQLTLTADMREYAGGGCKFYTKTRTIDQVMQRMLKRSDNLHAEAVFFQLANMGSKRHCTWKDGARIVESVMRKAGVNTSFVEVADGSGVSLYNYVSPDAQVSMLRYAYRTPSIYRYFYPALPIAGRDGTLNDRMRTGAAMGNVHAKTGTLEGVITLCGYVSASNGHQLAFSILLNGALSSRVARNFQDRVCQQLAR